MNINSFSIETVLAEAKKNPGKVVVPCANNEEAMEAVSMAVKDGVINGGTLIGQHDAIAEIAGKHEIDLGIFEVKDAEGDAEAAKIAARLIADNKADFLLKGQIDTKIYLKAVLDKELGLVQPGRTLTHVGFMYIPTYHKPIIVTDAAILIEPTLEDKFKMIDNAIEFAYDVGIKRPKISIQAAVEKINPKMHSTVDAEQIVKAAANGRFQNCVIEGPHDLYIATSKEGAKVKNVSGEVCGDADILVFNDINCANLFYKSMQRFLPGVWGAGLVVGAKKPILLPSRADESQAKRMSILFAAYVGAKKKHL